MHKSTAIPGRKPTVLCILVKSGFPLFKSPRCSAPKILSLGELKKENCKTYTINDVLDLHRFWSEPFYRRSCSSDNWSHGQGCNQPTPLRILFLKEEAQTLLTFKICFSCHGRCLAESTQFRAHCYAVQQIKFPQHTASPETSQSSQTSDFYGGIT